MTFREELERIGLPVPEELEHLGDVRRVTDWARRCGSSRSLLNARFREFGYLEPTQYIQLRRLITALRSLDEGNRLAEAARAAGYADELAMSTHCDELLGMRPPALRATDWRFVIRQRLRTS